ncbi:MAG: 16S rRNA (cytosine(1402)-N(4))-methyltransferase RsmH [Planctomycetota bacterium]|nr:16S rRNA (cytosine(1402)-N(4))-methyltransferase RsmH [Planctomycetota bacterium]
MNDTPPLHSDEDDSDSDDLTETSTAGAPHVSVMPAEVLELLGPKPGQFVVDCTSGAGGHGEHLLRAVAPGGRLLAIDCDADALALSRARLEPLARELNARVDFAHANFQEIARVLAEASPERGPDGMLADLGVSSMHFDRPERGFSFRHDAPLDMRMDPSQGETAAELLARLPETEIADTLYLLGGERGSRRIARRIVETRERGQAVRTTGELERLVRSALKVRGHKRIHPATRTFQALRMAVNRELEVLEAFLEAAPEALAPGGGLAVIAFHSGEDRRVKQGFKALAQTGRFLLIRKAAVRPSSDECRANPRSRSAKLRGLRRL